MTPPGSNSSAHHRHQVHSEESEQAAGGDDAEAGARTPRQQRADLPLARPKAFMTALVALTFLGALDHTIVATSLPRLAGDLGALSRMSWIIVGYTLAATVCIPIHGRLADMIGARRMLLIATAVFVLGSLGCGFARSIETLAAFRVLQGIGSAGMHLLPQTIIGAVVPARQRPQLMSWVGAAFPVAMVIGPLLGGLITDAWGWPWVFWVNVPIGLLTLLLAVRGIPPVEGGTGVGVDMSGALLVASLTISLVLASTWGAGDLGWSSPQTLGAATLACVSAIVLVPIERRASAPILPVDVLRHRVVAAATILSTIVGVGLFAVVQYIPTYIQLGFLVTASASGVVPMAMMFGMLGGTLLSGQVVSRTGRYRWAAVTGTATGALGLLTMALLPTRWGLGAPTLVLGLVGVGVGTFMQLVVTIAQAGAPREQIGTVTAMLTLSRQILSTVAGALVGSWVGTQIASGAAALGLSSSDLASGVLLRRSESTQQSVAALAHETWRPVFVLLAGVFLVGLVTALRLPHGALSEAASAD